MLLRSNLNERTHFRKFYICHLIYGEAVSTQAKTQRQAPQDRNNQNNSAKNQLTNQGTCNKAGQNKVRGSLRSGAGHK